LGKTKKKWGLNKMISKEEFISKCLSIKEYNDSTVDKMFSRYSDDVEYFDAHPSYIA
jgi:hypothetical protein